MTGRRIAALTLAAPLAAAACTGSVLDPSNGPVPPAPITGALPPTEQTAYSPAGPARMAAATQAMQPAPQATYDAPRQATYGAPRMAEYPQPFGYESGTDAAPAVADAGPEAVPQGDPGPAVPGEPIYVAPVIGASDEALEPLARAMVKRAAERGVKFVDDPGAAVVLKGYFSVSAAAQGSTVTYVWDVIDGAGDRLHRLQGAETAIENDRDPEAAMRAIGARTVDELAEATSMGPMTAARLAPELLPLVAVD